MQTDTGAIRLHHRSRARLRAVRGDFRRGGVPRLGARVRVADHHAIEWRRGREGEVVELFGGAEYTGAAVRLADGEERMFWAYDLVVVG